MANRTMRTTLAFAVIVLALLWLIGSGFKDNMQYFVGVKEVQAMGEAAYGEGLRVRGFLVPGSLQKSLTSLEATFLIEEDGHQMKVRYNKELPDTFRDGSEVLLEGEYTREGVFHARVLMAKCPSKYESTDDYYNVQNYDPEQHRIREGTN